MKTDWTHGYYFGVAMTLWLLFLAHLLTGCASGPPREIPQPYDINQQVIPKPSMDPQIHSENQ